MSLQISEILSSRLSFPDTDRCFTDIVDLQAILMQLDGEKQFDSSPCRAKVNLIKISRITEFIRNKIYTIIQQQIVHTLVNYLTPQSYLFKSLLS